MASELYHSTKALSVYNAVKATRRPFVHRGEILATLREFWRPTATEQDIDDGINFLLERDMVALDEDGAVCLARGPAAKIKRADGNDRELVWA